MSNNKNLATATFVTQEKFYSYLTAQVLLLPFVLANEKLPLELYQAHWQAVRGLRKVCDYGLAHIFF
jgi:hypothetical protein